MADFSKAEFVDAAILGKLLAAYQQASKRGTTLRLQFGTPTIVRHAFAVSGVLEVIEHFPTREEALLGKSSA